MNACFKAPNSYHWSLYRGYGRWLLLLSNALFYTLPSPDSLRGLFDRRVVVWIIAIPRIEVPKMSRLFVHYGYADKYARSWPFASSKCDQKKLAFWRKGQKRFLGLRPLLAVSPQRFAGSCTSMCQFFPRIFSACLIDKASHIALLTFSEQTLVIKKPSHIWRHQIFVKPDCNVGKISN